MHILHRLSAVALFVIAMGIHLHTNAQTPPYQLTKVGSGYEVKGLPPELILDYSRLSNTEELVASLVDPRYGTSKIQGYGHLLDDTTLLIETRDRFTFLPDLNRTYLLFEFENPPAGSSDCSGCTLTNTNLKARTPQICWCFSKLTASAGTDMGCRTKTGQLRFPTPSESEYKLKAGIGQPDRTADVYVECYPSSGEGGEDCTLFLGICDGVGGGASSLPGGGYGCHVPD